MSALVNIMMQMKGEEAVKKAFGVLGSLFLTVTICVGSTFAAEHDGQAVFTDGKRYITRDLDGHNGGAWKMADSVKNLGSQEARYGTVDVKLNRIGD